VSAAGRDVGVGPPIQQVICRVVEHVDDLATDDRSDV
jgi:hypothetical protein